MFIYRTISISFCYLSFYQELYHHVAESLGSTFPELRTNVAAIQTILDYEQENFRKLRGKIQSTAQLLAAEFPAEAGRIEEAETLPFYSALKLLDGEGGAAAEIGVNILT